MTRGLEVVGERWALLIIRDLLVGPRWYGELAAGLARIPSNILVARLKERQAAGVITGFAIGSIMPASMQTATLGVDRQFAGVASAMVNTSQQVGGSIGTALLNTLAATAATDYVSSHPPATATGAPTFVFPYSGGRAQRSERSPS